MRAGAGFLEAASCVLFHVDNFLDVSPLKQCRWFFSKLWQPISCGIENPPGAHPTCYWTITNIVDTANQSVSIRDSKRKKKPQYVIHPNTSVLFTYSSYRIVICLEINRAIYSIRSDGGTAADEMINSLITMLEEIHNSLQTQEHISRVFVTVIAHHSEINMTYGIWQKEINRNRSSKVQEDFFAIYSKKIEDLTFQRQVNPCFLGGGDCKQWSGSEGMNMNSIAEGILFHLNILPINSCPIALLITPGVVEVPVASITKSFAKANIPFHVLLVTLSSDTQPLGCVPEIDNLRVLAESSGGSFESVSPATKQNLESIGQIFLRPFYACRAESHSLREFSSPSGRSVRLKLYESRLRGYQLQGLTLEHIVASRLVEGYTIIGIAAEIQNLDTKANLLGKTCVNIRLEKHMTKVSSLTYIVSYFTDRAPIQYSTRRIKSEGDYKNLQGISSYGTGILSIEIICRCPQRIRSENSAHIDHNLHDNSTTSLLLNESRTIFDYDHRISLILEVRGMPGYVPSLPEGSTHAGTSESSIPNQSIQDVLYRQSLIFNQFLVSNDILENLCFLNECRETYLFLLPHSSDIDMIQIDDENRAKLFHNLQSISPHVHLYSSTATTMKGLCLTTVYGQPPNGYEIYDLYLIEIQIDSNYLTIKFSSLGNSPRGSQSLTLDIVTKNIQDTLQNLQLGVVQLDRNLSAISTSLTNSPRLNQMTYCYLNPCCKFYQLNLFTNPRLLDSYLSDFKKNKLCFGFRPTSIASGPYSKLQFSSILSISPSGMNIDSIFQCCVECSNEGVFVSYFLEPSYEHNPISQDPFQLTRVLDVPLGQSANLAIESTSSLLPDQQISNLLQNMLHQDMLLFDYYFAMTSVYHPPSTLDPPNAHQTIEIHSNYWSCLQSYSYTRKFFLPALSIPELCDQSLNVSLLEMLHTSLHELNLFHVDIIDKELLAFQSDYIFFSTIENGIMIIEINSKSLEVSKADLGTRTPTLDVVECKQKTISSQSVDLSSTTTDDDENTIESNNTPPIVRVLEKLNSMEPSDEIEVDICHQDTLSNSISIHYRFVSISLESLNSNSPNSYEIIRSSHSVCNILASDQNSTVDNPIYNAYFLDLNTRLQHLHGVNFSRIVYSSLLFHKNEICQPNDLKRALSYCNTNSIEMEAGILYRLKKNATSAYSVDTSALKIPLYQLTLGKYLVHVPNGDCLLFTPNQANQFHLQIDEKLHVYNCAVFVKLFVIRKSTFKNIDEEMEINSQEINTNDFFTEIFQKFYSLEDEETFDDIIFASSNDNISLKLEIYSAGYNEAQSTDNGLKEILNTLTHELETLIHYDSLYTLLMIPDVTRENIVLVQHSLRSTPKICQATCSLDFLSPPSGQGLIFIENVSQTLEEELLLTKKFKKIGDIIYAREWLLILVSDEGKSEPKLIPCWILLTISQSSLLEGGDLVDNMQVISMEVSVILFAIGEYQAQQDIIVEEISSELKKCCHQVNQKILLRDLNSTRLASSYLMKTFVEADTPSHSAVSLTRASRLQQIRNKDVIPTFIIPENPPSLIPCYKRADFKASCFECEIRGRIDLILPADVSNVLNNSLSHHHTVTMLESTALHPFLISNVRKCFVYQHKNGDVYYMAFAPPKDEKDQLVSLIVFGVSELNLTIKTELKKVLEVKLTEYIANVISVTMVPRRTILPTTHVQFLRDCGLSKRVDFIYQLPVYVTDPYFFCVIAKQLFSKSEIFMALTIQYNDRQEHLSSHLHPAMYGYDDSHHTTDATLGQQEEHQVGKLNHQSIFRPHLERKKQVDKELCSELVVHPIFFDRTRKLQTPRNEKRHDASLIVWDQGDFTLLYNSHDKEKNKRNIAQKRAFTQSGGLALIEFQPTSELNLSLMGPHTSSTGSLLSTPPPSSREKNHSQTFTTGSEENLINDVNRLVEYLKLHPNINLEPAKSLEVSALASSDRILSEIHDQLVVRIYPTRGINPKTLMEGLHNFFHQALIYYSLERIFSVYNNPNHPHEQIFTPNLCPSQSTPQDTTYSPINQNLTPFASVPIAADLFKSYQKLIFHNSSDLLPYISQLNIPIRLSQTDANSLYHRILSWIFSQFPYLVDYTIFPVSFQSQTAMDWLEPEHDPNKDSTAIKYSTCSCLLGENFITFDRNKYPKEIYKWKGSSRDGHLHYISPDHRPADAVNGLRHISDFTPDKSLLFPLWLRKRRYSIEVTITSNGINAYFFNIEKKHIDGIQSIVQDYSKDILETIHRRQLTYLEKISFAKLVSPLSHQSFKEKENLKFPLIQRLSIQIQGLFWSQRVFSRIFLFSSRGLSKTPSGNLSNYVSIQNELRDIPFKIWGEGILLKREYVPLPVFQQYDQSHHPSNLIEDYALHLSHLVSSFDCYFIENLESRQISILLPIPNTASLYTIQLSCFSSLYLGITYRVIDCSDVIRSVALEYKIEEPDVLITQITRCHLDYPSIGIPNEEDEKFSVNVMDSIYHHPTIHKLNINVLYAMLSTLYFQNFCSHGNEVKANGSRIIATLKMIASAIPEDIHMEVKNVSLSWISENNLSVSPFQSPAVEDVIEMFSQAPLSDRSDCVPYESSDQKFAFFRFLATSKFSLLNSHRRGSSEFSDNQKLQRRVHAIYANAILGIAFLEPNRSHNSPADSFQLTLFLFPGDRVIGSEKGLASNPDLEGKMNHLLLQRMRFIQSNEKTTILRQMKKNILRSGKLAVKLIENKRAWDVLYHPTHLSSFIPTAADTHSHLLEALAFHSKVISLEFLNFILPMLTKLIVRVEYQHLFIGILQRVFQQQFSYFLITEEKEKEEEGGEKAQSDDLTSKKKETITHEHYLITGRNHVDSSQQRFVIHIHVTDHQACEIKLIESNRRSSHQQQQQVEHEQQLIIGNLVDIILYALGVICDDDAKLITT